MSSSASPPSKWSRDGASAIDAVREARAGEEAESSFR